MANPKDGLTFVWIPPGKFEVGCSPGDAGCGGDERPAHEVTITRGFWLGQTPVTQRACQRVTGQDPSSHKGGNLPVETVDWNEAKAYCVAIGGRLPTEAQREYAARPVPRVRATAIWMRLPGTQRTAEAGLVGWDRSCRILSGCTTCWGTPGSGSRTGTGTIRRTRRWIPPGPGAASTKSRAADRGAVLPGWCARRTVAGSSHTIAAANSAFGASLSDSPRGEQATELIDIV